MNTIELAYQPFESVASAPRISNTWLWIALLAFGIIFILLEVNGVFNSDVQPHDSDYASRAN